MVTFSLVAILWGLSASSRVWTLFTRPHIQQKFSKCRKMLQNSNHNYKHGAEKAHKNKHKHTNTHNVPKTHWTARCPWVLDPHVLIGSLDLVEALEDAPRGPLAAFRYYAKVMGIVLHQGKALLPRSMEVPIAPGTRSVQEWLYDWRLLMRKALIRSWHTRREYADMYDQEVQVELSLRYLRNTEAPQLRHGMEIALAGGMLTRLRQYKGDEKMTKCRCSQADSDDHRYWSCELTADSRKDLALSLTPFLWPRGSRDGFWSIPSSLRIRFEKCIDTCAGLWSISLSLIGWRKRPDASNDMMCEDEAPDPDHSASGDANHGEGSSSGSGVMGLTRTWASMKGMSHPGIHPDVGAGSQVLKQLEWDGNKHNDPRTVALPDHIHPFPRQKAGTWIPEAVAEVVLLGLRVDRQRYEPQTLLRKPPRLWYSTPQD